MVAYNWSSYSLRLPSRWLIGSKTHYYFPALNQTVFFDWYFPKDRCPETTCVSRKVRSPCRLSISNHSFIIDHTRRVSGVFNTIKKEKTCVVIATYTYTKSTVNYLYVLCDYRDAEGSQSRSAQRGVATSAPLEHHADASIANRSARPHAGARPTPLHAVDASGSSR